jgi:hypothetical protein
MLSEFVEQRLEDMLSHPEHWGGAEAYELQALLLLELRLLLSHQTSEAESLRTINDLYSAFVASEYPEVGARPLSATTSDFGQIARALRRFRDTLVHSASFSSAQRGPSNAVTRRGLGLDVEVFKDSTMMPRMH